MKSIAIRCDGEGCSERFEVPSESSTALVDRPRWLVRKVSDVYMNEHGTQRMADQLLHFCPRCIPSVEPPLHPHLSRP